MLIIDTKNPIGCDDCPCFESNEEICRVNEKSIHSMPPSECPIIDNENGWIPVKERLPEYGEKVLVILEHEKVVYDVAERVNYKHPQFNAYYYWVGRYGYDPSNVVAWQTLPELPKGE